VVPEKNMVKGLFFVVNDSLTMFFPTVVYRPLCIFLPGFFDNRGGREPLAKKIGFVVDGFHRVIKMLTSS
jgi:hypothetical protein